MKNRKEDKGYWVGDLYEFEDGKSMLVQKTFQVTENTSKPIRFFLILQQIAEGYSLKTILGSHIIQWTPSFYEFLMWVDGDSVYKNAYHKAKVMRSQGVIENLFQQVEKAGTSLNEDKIKEHISILQSISKALEKEIEGEDVNLIDIQVVSVDHVSKFDENN